MAHHNDSDHEGELGHILPKVVYFKVLIALGVLTVITVGAAQINFGVMNIVIAMFIASIKAGIVALFFMHLKYESPITWAYVAFPLIILLIMLGGIFIDNPFRVP